MATKEFHITKDDLPPASIRKQQLEQKIAEFKQQGYSAQMQVRYLGVQVGEDTADQRKIKLVQESARRLSENHYRSARELTKELEELLAEERAAAEQPEEAGT